MATLSRRTLTLRSLSSLCEINIRKYACSIRNLSLQKQNSTILYDVLSNFRLYSTSIEKKQGNDGIICEGLFEGVRLVQGRMLLPDGRIYEGEFDQGSGHIKDGGILRFPVDDVPYMDDEVSNKHQKKHATYQGQFSSWCRHGKGKTIYPSGCVIEEGRYENNIFQEGRVVMLNSISGVSSGSVDPSLESKKSRGVTIFEGKLVDGHFSEGKLVSAADDSVYEGQFCNNNLPQGRGKLSYSEVMEDSTKKSILYIGNFQNGAMSGEGQLKVTFPNGSSVVYEGRFEAGAIKEGSLILRDGSRYEGEFNEAGEMHGRGRYESGIDQNVYTGLP